MNAANGKLSHGGGVAGAIRKSGGAAIVKESSDWIKKNGKVPTGESCYTGAGKLKAKYVIHTVGPEWNAKVSSQENAAIHYKAIMSSILTANKLQCKSISIPAISSGIFGFPKPLVGENFLQVIFNWVIE